MLISYNRLKELIDFSYSPEELDKILTMLGIEVEYIFNYKNKYKNFYIGEVLSKEKHPQADKLSLCQVNYGKGINTVVCGAPNVDKGQKIVYAALDALIPNGEFKIERRTIRGIASEGMICSQVELDLGEDSNGIWVLNNDAEVGQELVDYLNINDVIFEISVTPNRPDCLSHFGIARLIAAYKNEKFQKIKFELNKTEINIDDEISVEIQNKDLCPRYTGIVIKNIKSIESPFWLQSKLKMLGLRTINAVVDITNYVMYETGQPLHAFDLDKIKGNKIVIKTAKNNEKFTPLDDKERILDEKTLMICDAEKSIAIAGVMGGKNSEIDNNTKNIFIESAYFNPQSVRRTSKKLSLQTDASYRFERGADYENVLYANEYAAKLISDICGGEVSFNHIDEQIDSYKRKEIELNFQKATKLIGVEINKEDMIKYLEALEFNIIEQTEEKVKVSVPSYRVDIEEEVNLIEEIAIMYNYDNIAPSYSTNINFSNSINSSELLMPELRHKTRNYFVQNGFTEILTQNIIDPKSAKLFADDNITLSNPLGEEMSVMRPSLIPSMLKTIERNIRHGNSSLRLFEIGKKFLKNISTNKAGEKEINFIEDEELIISLSGLIAPFNWKDKERNVDYFDIKGILEDFIDRFNINAIKLEQNDYLKNIFSANSLAIIFRGKAIGRFGEVSKKILKQFEIEKPVFIIVMNMNLIYGIKQKSRKFEGISPFPSVNRDLGFIISKEIEAEAVRSTIVKAGGKFLQNVEIFDVYEGEKIGNENKNIAFALTYLSNEKTLTDQEVDASIKAIIDKVTKQFNAKLREF